MIARTLAAAAMVVSLFSFATGQTLRAAELVVTPTQVTLSDPEAAFQLLVSTTVEDQRRIDLTRKVRYESLNAKIATVDETGLVEAADDGETDVVIHFEKQSAKVHVKVQGTRQPRPLSFADEIMPALTKAGCNTGGCHGKAEGQNGFKLSVFGFDPQADHNAIVHYGRGRRVFLSAPDRSLLLRKATAVEPHGGGQRIQVGDLHYRRLLRWLSEGGGWVEDDRPKLVRIEVEPTEQTLLARETQQLRVWAIDAAGGRTCVTTEAEYESNAGTIAGVDRRGYIEASDIPGEAAVLARYQGYVAVSRITIPRPGPKYARPPENNFIDHLAWDKLQRLGLEASPLCDDATYLRRVFLDIIGTLPTGDEARAFLADTRPDKRAKLVDHLLDRPEYVDYWTMRFSDILRIERGAIGADGAVAITRWLRRQFSENRPYDSMVRELLLARGNVKAEGPAAYYKAMPNAEVLARSVSQAFLGVRIECAQCHHHPSERWGQDDYFALAGMFNGIARKRLAPSGEEFVVPAKAVDLKHPRTGEAVAARPLGVEPKEDVNPLADRRVWLVEWMLDDKNAYFSTLIANRLWAHYLGRGLVEQIDDLRTTNPASNEPLLAALAEHMRKVKYDLKQFTRTLLASRVYQLASTTTESNALDEQNFSHALHKPMPAEVLLDAINQVTGGREDFEGWPAGYRSIQLWDNRVPSYFFRIFGRPARATVCECERSNEPSIAQALHLMNSPEIAEKIRMRSGTAATLALSKATAEELIESVFLSALARKPSEQEMSLLRAVFAEGGDRRAAVEDVMWAVLNSKEFLYNH